MWRRMRNGFQYALTGLGLVWAEELNFKIEIACALLALALGWFFGLAPLEFALLVVSIACVLTTETLNTALEELCDKFQPTHDPHIAKIKDLAAAAVLLSSLGALAIGIIVFAPHVL